MHIENKRVLVTGAANGVGKVLTVKLLDLGCSVIAIDLDESGLNKLMQENDNEKLYTYKADITNIEQIKELYRFVIDNTKGIDILINNAGIIQPFVNIEDLDIEAIYKVTNVNYFGTVNMTKVFLPCLLDEEQGHIVNTSSMGAFLPVVGQSAYGASKAAVKQFSLGMQTELKHTNVNMSLIIPGGIITDIKKNSGIESHIDSSDNAKEEKIISTPDHVANMIIKSIVKNKKKIYVGKDCKTMHVLNTISPKLSVKLISSVMDNNEH